MGADPSLIGAKTWLDMEAELASEGLVLVSFADNLIDRVWTVEDGRDPFVVREYVEQRQIGTNTKRVRNCVQAADLVVQDLEYAGQTCQSKLADLRAQLTNDFDEEYLAMVVSELDEVAWLFNLRGEGDEASIEVGDVNMAHRGKEPAFFYIQFQSPLFLSVALVSQTEAFLWLQLDKVTPEVQAHLDECGVQTG